MFVRNCKLPQYPHTNKTLYFLPTAIQQCMGSNDLWENRGAEDVFRDVPQMYEKCIYTCHVMTRGSEQALSLKNTSY